MQLEITSREAYVIATALYREIKRQKALPEDLQDWSDTEDMKELLERHFCRLAGLLSAMDRGAGRLPLEIAGGA